MVAFNNVWFCFDFRNSLFIATADFLNTERLNSGKGKSSGKGMQLFVYIMF